MNRTQDGEFLELIRWKLTTHVELLKDPLFKRYSAVVDRALSVFDTIVEWPDYIAFLGKLLKVRQPRCHRNGDRHFKHIRHVGLFHRNWWYQVV